MTPEQIAARLHGKKTPNGWECKCPAHDDQDASLSISEGSNGKTILKCFAGCSFDQIAQAAEIKKSEFFGDDAKPHRSRIVAEYSYQDADGKELFQVVRIDPKDFRQRVRNGGGWKWSTKGVTRQLYRLPQVLAAKDAGKVIFVVEGEKDVAALESIGCTATCNPGGAGKWEPQYTETLAGASVVIMPDQDRAGRAHCQLVGKALAPVCTSVRVINLPVKDAADWVAQGNAKADLVVLFKSAQPWEESDDPGETKSAQIGDARSVTSADNGAKGGRPKAPPHADTAERYANEALRDDQSMLLVRHWHGQWYAYKGNGWREIADIEIQGRLVTWFQNDEELRTHANANYAASAILNLRSHNICGLPESVEKPCWLDTGESARNWVAFRNGVVVNVWRYAEALARGDPAGSDCIRELSPDFFSSDFVDYEWNPECFAEKFHAYIERVQPESTAILSICEMMGLLMADTTRYEVFWQLYGSGSNGKTVLLDIIKAMVGAHNVSFVPLPALIENFGAWPVAESKVNICGELPTDTGRGSLYAIEGEFKNCVSGGEIEYQKKNRDKYPAKCRARFLMATNSLPTFVDKSDGIWRRLRIIPFAEKIGDEEKDVNLADKIIQDEMPGVLAWALDGLANVIRQGGVSESDGGKRAKDEHRSGCDHERQFLDENYDRGGTDDRIKSQDIYNHYKEWMGANGYRALGVGKFKTRVVEIMPISRFASMQIGIENVMGVDCVRRKSQVCVND